MAERQIDAPWWRGAAIYQIYPRSFRDANGDGVGDLVGIAENLGYVASLGVDGIWISPFFRSPMRDFGYDVEDHCDVDPVFGTLSDFDRLVARAHDLGLRVVIDQVYSHTSDRHAWFAESRESRDNGRADWYVWADAKADGTPPNNWQSVFGGPAWTWDARRRQYYFHNYLSSQPDLNLHHPRVREALIDIARFWLARGVDGLRLDAINYGMHDPELRDNPAAPPGERSDARPWLMQQKKYNTNHPQMPRFLEELCGAVDAYGDILTVAEVGGQAPLETMRRYTRGRQRLSTAYGFDFLTAPALRASHVREVLSGWPNGSGGGWPSWAFSNHDAPRVASRWDVAADRDRIARLAGLLLVCLRGNIFVYQGEELGLPQAEVPFEALKDPEAIAHWPHTLGRDGARTPLPWNAETGNCGFSTARPWLPVDPRHAALSIDRQQRDAGSVLCFFRRLLGLRRDSDALRHGDLDWLDAPGELLAFRRRAAAEAAHCVFNLGAQPLDWTPPAGSERLRIGVGIDAGGDRLPVTLPGYSGYLATAID